MVQPSAGDRLQQGPRVDVRSAGVVALAAATPFVVGRLAGGALLSGGGHVWCPFRAATGVPCPLCGATRSVVLASRGDVAFLQYNPVWVGALAVVALVGFGVALAGRRGREVRFSPRTSRAVVAFVFVVGWVCALAHHHAITSS
ncbi:MAG: hypothetical protein JWQ18_2258 [Conexibacter sp.]|nr:hypothetical protein [Conexibacter sp.]